MEQSDWSECYNHGTMYVTHTAMIIHALDVRRVLSILPVVTSKQVEIFNIKIDQKGVLVKKRRNDLKILCLLKCVLDVAMSISASVIVSLLLLSGDIEQNPGPLGGKAISLKWGSSPFASGPKS